MDLRSETKTCYVCKEKKGRSAFQKDRSQPDGLQTRCRRCRNLGLTLKQLTGIHGLKKIPGLSDFPIGPYKENTFESFLKRFIEIENESKIIESRKIALESAAMQLLIASKNNSYTHLVYGTMSIEKGKLVTQLNDSLEVSEEDE